MIDWQTTARVTIGHVHASLPVDADLKTRKAALRAAKPWEFSATSWGKKVWAKHTRLYLEKHGQEKRQPRADKHLSPMERAKKATEEHQLKLRMSGLGYQIPIDTRQQKGQDNEG